MNRDRLIILILFAIFLILFARYLVVKQNIIQMIASIFEKPKASIRIVD